MIFARKNHVVSDDKTFQALPRASTADSRMLQRFAIFLKLTYIAANLYLAERTGFNLDHTFLPVG